MNHIVGEEMRETGWEYDYEVGGHETERSATICDDGVSRGDEGLSPRQKLQNHT
jgi:hypothetical protein